MINKSLLRLNKDVIISFQNHFWFKIKFVCEFEINWYCSLCANPACRHTDMLNQISGQRRPLIGVIHWKFNYFI